MSPRNWYHQKTPQERNLEVFHNIGSAKEKMLEANPNLEVRQFPKAQERYLLSMISSMVKRRQALFKERFITFV